MWSFVFSSCPGHDRCGHTVLDVGSGLGGPARYIASRCQCHVVAVELQEDLHRTAVDLTERCGLADNVRHLHANFITDNIGELHLLGLILKVKRGKMFQHAQEKQIRKSLGDVNFISVRKCPCI